jgi:hypothetical protein
LSQASSAPVTASRRLFPGDVAMIPATHSVCPMCHSSVARLT